MLNEIESVTSFDAQELAVNPAVVAIISSDDLPVANTQSGSAAVSAVRANRADVLHFPGPRLITINSTRKSAHRTNIDTRAAFVAFQIFVVIGNDFRNHTAIPDA